MFQRFKPLLDLVRKISIPWLLLGSACGLALIETAAALWIPMLTRDLVDAAGAGGVPRSLMVTLTAVLLAQAGISGVSLYLLARAGEHMTAFLRNLLFSRLVRLPMSFHDDTESGELVSRTLSDTAAVESLLTEQAIAMIASTIAMFGSIIILCWLDWRLTAVLFSSLLLGLVLVLPVVARLQAVGHEMQSRQAVFSGRLTGSLGEARLLKASCAEEAECRSAAKSIDGLRLLGLAEARIMALLGPVSTLALTGALVVILGYGGARVGTGELAVGTLVAFMLYLFQVAVPMVQMSTFFAALSKAAGAAEYLNELLEKPLEDPVADGGQAPVGSVLQFKDVQFGYGSEKTVLDGLNLELKPDTVTALVGPSGSGKTTILSLLERFYPTNAGSITVGGKPIDQLALEPWRRRIGYVPQEAPVISGTVRDNLCYGLKEEPTAVAITSALRAARAEGFVSELSEGLDTQVGERGAKLSGGQRQRLAIARAFLTDPEILMLDEATANLDAESEDAVRAALAELMHGRTTLVVAHRLATVVDADQIAVIEKGRVTGLGTHRGLMADHELYRQLAERQFVQSEVAA